MNDTERTQLRHLLAEHGYEGVIVEVCEWLDERDAKSLAQITALLRQATAVRVAQ